LSSPCRRRVRIASYLTRRLARKRLIVWTRTIALSILRTETVRAFKTEPVSQFTDSASQDALTDTYSLDRRMGPTDGRCDVARLWIRLEHEEAGPKSYADGLASRRRSNAGLHSVAEGMLRVG
jgi:hypothetical protein